MNTIVASIRAEYLRYKALAEAAIAQLSESELVLPGPGGENSVAVICWHVAGNLRSRFTDFLTTDGEKPDRNRDAEFEMRERAPREDILRWWESGWATALAALESLTPEDLERTIYIRGEAFLVVESLDRLAAHAAYHVGQIVYLAKHFAGPTWTSLSIPKGKSSEFAKGEFKRGIVPKQ